MENPYRYYIENNLDTHVGDARGEFYVDLLRRPVLVAALDQDPGDGHSAIDLFGIDFRWGRYMEAYATAQLLHGRTGDDEWIISQLRCLLLAQEFDHANAVHEFHNGQRKKPLVDDWKAIQLLRDVIFSDYFCDLSEADFGKLFFLRPLLRNFGRHLKFLSYSLSDRFHLDLIALAKDHVESKGARFQYISVSDLYAVKNKSETEKHILDHVTQTLTGRKEDSRLSWLQSNPQHLADMHADLPQYNSDYIAEICAGPKNMVQSVKLVMGDWSSDNLNVERGQRVTAGQPQEFKNRVMVFGASDAFGFGSEDKYTFCSFLQEKLNNEQPELRRRVENFGIRGSTLPFTLCNLKQTSISAGDHVFIFGYPELEQRHTDELGIDAHHINFSRPHDAGEIYIDHTHFGWTGNRAIGNQLYDLLRREPVKTGSPVASDPERLYRGEQCVSFVKYLLYRRTCQSVEESGMSDYLFYLEQNKFQQDGSVGSVAVNCNPMTLGHLHLLEYAASQVDLLYVFIIEEDQFFFRFEDRLETVTRGLAHLDNVKVLKGGRYICTDITFPEYTSKEDAKDVVADASMEAWFFCEFIAKKLNIEKIFLGREPKCQITQQYNDQMATILPTFDIEVDIIERIGTPDGPISASSVREYLRHGEFDMIRQIVPDATYDYLIEKYKNTGKRA